MVKLKIEGMTCGHCVLNVKKALADVLGVTSVEVDLQTGEAKIEGSTDTDALVKAVEGEGYTAQLA